ncbi:SH3 domain-containing protein [Bacillus sp. 31A1R]|uniref:SH3 domain-containing protein n=1 Tax=Robertmurraya mangrovi TaxID=3098077 RepID=A0ABU5ITF9_9BACI|nr:SH3 domain-containing protein [Bacillus sp. 31A1R]MDZ5470411.1 SH3 domain-containing protein [Bacillus sp. 31A1R]
MKFNIKLLFIFLIIFNLLNYGTIVEGNTTKTAIVSLENGKLNVRNGAGAKYKIIGTLKNGTKVKIYSQTEEWAEIRYKKKTAYISNKYLIFPLKISIKSVSKIIDNINEIQYSAFEKGNTKKDIYKIMKPNHTKPYIDKFFKDYFYVIGKDRNGNNTYRKKPTEIESNMLPHFDWYLSLDYSSAKTKPKISYYEKQGTIYLTISQYFSDSGMIGKRTKYAFLYNKDSNWIVYDAYDKIHGY